MLNLKGKYGEAIIYGTIIDDSTIEQINKLLDQPFTKDCKIRIMEDNHAGAGCCIGFTANLGDKVVPNLVGVDIGCFTGDTKVKLTDGRDLSFIELIEEYNAGKDNYCYSIDNNCKIQISKIDHPRKIKNSKHLILITLDNNEQIKCTLDHKFYLINGNEIEAKDLKVGDALFPLYIDVCKNIDLKYNIQNIYKHDNRLKNKHLCLYQPTFKNYEFIHHIADKYNERHNNILQFKMYDDDKKSFVRHHIDFNKYNNNPNNIKRVGFKEHWDIHAKNIKKTNELGITGFTAAKKLHPNLNSKAGKIGAASMWDNSKNGLFYRQRAKDRIVNYNKSEKCRAKSRERQLLNNSNKWAELNNDPVIKYKQKLAIIRKVCNKALEIHGTINEFTFNDVRQYFNKNVITFKKAIDWCNKNNLNIYDIPTYKNHKIIDIKFLENVNEDVYCLTNFEYGNFALRSGVFVHNCGILTVPLGNVEIDFKKLDKIIKEKIPAGFNIHKQKIAKFDKIQELYCYRDLKDTRKIDRALATTGGGNHFEEIDVDEDGNKYLLIHIGSRNLGKQVCDYYQKFAHGLMIGKDELINAKEKLIKEYKEQGRKKEIQSSIAELNRNFKCKHTDVPNELSYLYGEYTKKYIHDMYIVQEYAALNRFLIAKIIVENLFDDCNVRLSSGGSIKIKQKGKYNISETWFDTIHNYIGKDNIIRKGAIAAYKDQIVAIPMNMKDGTLICIGKGNEARNYSAPHGAGRIYSRKQAKENISLSKYAESMKGIFTTCINEGTLDEAPQSYKPIDEIMKTIGDTVEIIKVIKPIYNFKASGDDNDWRKNK